MLERQVRTCLEAVQSKKRPCVAVRRSSGGFYIMTPPSSVPRSGPRNIRVYDPTTNTLSVNWDHAEGPVVQYRITYVQTTGDPIEEYVSTFRIPLHSTLQPSLII